MLLLQDACTEKPANAQTAASEEATADGRPL
jgi:hypothetical protein